MIEAILFLFGLIIGSFLNVCIVRLPLEQSIVSPPSKCPRCGARIAWYDNIPVISFLLLQARCRTCGQHISWRYPVVELLNGLLYLWTATVFGISGEALLVMMLCSAFLVITFIDLDHQIIPDVITLPGIVLGLAAAPFFMAPLDVPLPFHLGQYLHLSGRYPTALVNSVIGLLFGGGPLFLIGWIWEKLRKVEAMGGGDVKLMAMVGAFIGWKGALLSIFFGALAGSVVGVALIALKKHKSDKVMPFGPYLVLGALVALFYGPAIIDWYFGLLTL
jgi:leader peptidase (prepilin peptidase)/N-methyltransferase